MSTAIDTVQALPKTMDLRSLRQGPFLQNVRLHPDGAWHVRTGLGVRQELDSRLSAGPETAPTGPTTRLGTYVAKTGPNGSEQLLILSYAEQLVGDDSTSNAQPVTLLHVHDVNYRRTAEHVLQNRSDTDESKMPFTLPWAWQPTQAAGAGTSDCGFTVIDNVVLFGSKDTGLWAYYGAAVVNDHRCWSASHQNTTANRHAPTGESCQVRQLVPAVGPLSATYSYLLPGELPAPTALANWHGRLVLVSGRTVYFSDPFNPQWWVADNQERAPVAGTITAVQASRDVILVWTATETWAYNPPSGVDILSGGQWYRLSDSTGCLSPRSQALVGSTVVWADQTGVFTHTSGISFNKISNELNPFFEGGEPLQSPLNLYHLDTGATDPTVAQPPIERVFTRPTVSWFERRGEVFVSFPEQDFAFVLRQGAWSTWQTGTVANSANNVAWTNTLPFTEYVGTAKEVLAVSLTTGEVLDRQVNATCITELGRGGSLDRSEQGTTEDIRKAWGQWELTALNSATTSDAEVWIGEPLVRQVGYATGTAQTLTEKSYWFPVILVPPSDINITDLDIRIEFDNVNWTALHVAGAGASEIDFQLLKDDILVGFSPGAMVAGSEVRTYSAGVPAAGGNEIRIGWAGGLTGTDQAPNMDASVRTPRVLLWLPFTVSQTALSTSNIWTAANQADYEDSVAVQTRNAKLRWWQFPLRVGDDLLNSSQQQMCVDWAVKTDQIQDKGKQLKCRGVYARVESTAKATSSIVTGYVYGLVNSTTGSDYKDWATQTIDVGIAAVPAVSQGYPPGDTEIYNEESLRKRLFTSQLYAQTYNNQARWASTATPADGNMLSGSQPVDTFATSEGVRGEHVSVMLHGTVQNKAERFAVESLDVAIRAKVGERRRQGR